MSKRLKLRVRVSIKGNRKSCFSGKDQHLSPNGQLIRLDLRYIKANYKLIRYTRMVVVVWFKHAVEQFANGGVSNHSPGKSICAILRFIRNLRSTIHETLAELSPKNQ